MKKEFNFTWAALNLLGKSLYSNAWAAISELVANGLDAKATHVSVFIDARTKNDASIQIMDNGTGMRDEAIDTYVNVGYDRRDYYYHSDSPTEAQNNIMGRKGIGKPAALYLSKDYYIQTKTSDSAPTTWHLASDTHLAEKPYLILETGTDIDAIDPEWEQSPSGTLLILNHVDLTGLGEVAFNALSHNLANHFLSSSMQSQAIYLGLARNEKEYNEHEFHKVEKMIAFHNYAMILENLSPENEPKEIREIKERGSTVLIPYPNSDESKRTKVQVSSFSSVNVKDSPSYQGIYEISSEFLDTKILRLRQDVKIVDGIAKIPYQLTGWIGFHSTLNNSQAQQNDSNFRKNKNYNPAQIRLYVRNKLAVSNVLDTLGITQAFTNYIEGEISFDLLDDDLLPDIATSSRQGYNQLDGRWSLLVSILRPLVRSLITRRNEISKSLRQDITETVKRAKDIAVRDYGEYIDEIPDIPSKTKIEVKGMMAMQLKGEVEAKQNYKIFLSHKSDDARFTNFIYKLLEQRGARKTDFFYTSADDNTEKYNDITSLSTQIKNNIVDDKSLIVYLATPLFKKSEFCLFEAGAGWATRGIEDYKIIGLRYEDIPQYLTNGKSEFSFLTNSEKSIELNKRTYLYLIDLFNHLIDHINKSREIKGEELVERFDQPQFEDAVQMRKKGKTEKDYMDPMVIDYWDTYVAPGLAEYLASITTKESVRP